MNFAYCIIIIIAFYLTNGTGNVIINKNQEKQLRSRKVI